VEPTVVVATPVGMDQLIVQHILATPYLVALTDIVPMLTLVPARVAILDQIVARRQRRTVL